MMKCNYCTNDAVINLEIDESYALCPLHFSLSKSMLKSSKLVVKLLSPNWVPPYDFYMLNLIEETSREVQRMKRVIKIYPSFYKGDAP